MVRMDKEILMSDIQSFRDTLVDAIYEAMFTEAKFIKDKILAKSTKELREELENLAAQTAIKVARHCEVETFGDKLTITLRLPE
jgi:hypothetical protein